MTLLAAVDKPNRGYCGTVIAVEVINRGVPLRVLATNEDSPTWGKKKKTGTHEYFFAFLFVWILV